jgi:tripartite-type tricarboxylate transporter receptor subunit TctC
MKKFLITLALITGFAQAQTVEMIVPFPPGGASDTVARLVQQEIVKDTGISVIAVNKPGADGSIAAREFLSPGKTTDRILIVTTGTSLFNKLTRQEQNTSIDPIDDFEIVGPIATSNTIVAVHADSKIQSLAELESIARNQVVNCGTSNAMGIFFVRTWAAKKQLKINVIPFKGGADLLSNIMGKHIDCAIAPWFELSGKNTIRPIATSTRDSQFGSNLPLMDLGAYKFYNFYAVSFHKGMNPVLRQKISSVLMNLKQQPEFIRSMHERGFFVPVARIDFTQILQHDYRTLEQIRTTLPPAQ